MGRHVSHKNTIMTQAREDSLYELVSRLHIPNIDITVLDCAFTHTSYANEQIGRASCRERVEMAVGAG